MLSVVMIRGEDGCGQSVWNGKWLTTYWVWDFPIATKVRDIFVDFWHHGFSEIFLAHFALHPLSMFENISCRQRQSRPCLFKSNEIHMGYILDCYDGSEEAQK